MHLFSVYTKSFGKNYFHLFLSIQTKRMRKYLEFSLCFNVEHASNVYGCLEIQFEYCKILHCILTALKIFLFKFARQSRISSPIARNISSRKKKSK